ncbi:MAG TPA: non-homologous end-joining DNA ligase [Flavisolibacter sp.]|nr:non-homologous end-joining DNA ligase [Flavisolibacter sp.]
MQLRKGKQKKDAAIASTKRGKPGSISRSTPKQVSDEIRIEQGKPKNWDWTLSVLKRQLKGVPKSGKPNDYKPMLASIVKEPFNDADWLYEIKWDGYRALAYVGNGKAELRSRNNLSFASKFPTIIKALKELPFDAVLDGEVVVLNEEGKADFGAIQSWHKTPKGHLVYYVFDLLWLEGMNLENEPLWRRKEILRKLIPNGGPIRFSESILEYGVDFFKAAKENGLEGIIAKQKNSLYQLGLRTNDWVKIKAEQQHEAIICGFTKKRNTDRLFSSLILGIPDGDGLKFIGQVGTGFTQALQRELLAKLKHFQQDYCPFDKKPGIIDKVQWVEPQLLCEVKYTELTKEGVMRHPSFKGVREDKELKDINLEGEVVQTKKSAKEK